MTDNVIRAVDLFCGAGGTLEGLSQACDELGVELQVTAVNHWATAIETHKRNHPNGDHHVSKVEELHPPDVVKEGGVDVLIASPECTHFSVARGGKPVNLAKALTKQLLVGDEPSLQTFVEQEVEADD